MTKAADINFKAGNSYESLLDIIYPVNSIYLSVSSTSPANLFGGTWVEAATDAVLAARGTSYTTTAGNKGGSTKIATTQLPSHTHGHAGTNAAASSAGAHTHVQNVSGDFTTGTAFSAGAQTDNTKWVAAGKVHYIGGGISTQSAGAHTHSLTGNTAATGGGNAYSPYHYSVYVWKRTA